MRRITQPPLMRLVAASFFQSARLAACSTTQRQAVEKPDVSGGLLGLDYSRLKPGGLQRLFCVALL